MNPFSHTLTFSLLLLLATTCSFTNAAQHLIIPHPSLAPAPSPHHHHHHHHHHHLHSPTQPPSQPPTTTTTPPPSKPPTPPPSKPPTTPPTKPPTKPPTTPPTTPPTKPPTAPPAKPPTAPPAKPPTTPPAKPPTTPPAKPLPRKLVAIQGVVYCKNCSYVGVNTLLGASPLAGAKVVLRCRNTQYLIKSSATTDKNGYFFIQAPPLITTYGIRKCHVSLVKKRHVEGACSNPTNLHGGLTGAPLVLDRTPPTKPLNFTLFTVGPFAFEPLNKCINH